MYISITYMATSKNLSVHAVISRGWELLASYVSAMFQLCFSYVFNAFQGTVLWFTFNRYFMDFKWESCQFCISSLLFFSIISMEFFKVAHRNLFWRACIPVLHVPRKLLGGSKLLNLLGGPLGGLKESCAECLPWCLAGCTWSAILHLADRSVRHLCLLHPHCFCSTRFSKFSAVCEHSLNIAWT